MQLKVLARMKAQASFSGPEVPFATVVTDLTRCHRTWFHKQVDKCFVATQLVAAQAMEVGLTAKQLSCYGQGRLLTQHVFAAQLNA